MTGGRNEIKNIGYVYRKGRPEDEGNYMYSVLFVMMDRSDVFVSIIKIVIHMIKADPPENMRLGDCNGKKRFCDGVLRSRESASEFFWAHVVLELQDYNYPQERLTVFIRGMHKALCERIPPPSPLRLE